MDDDSAEIELLEQNLRKTRQISQRMTSILSSFDARLVRVEKSILPLYNVSQMLNNRGNNIESALLKIDEIKSNQEGVAAEEAFILRGPQIDQFDDYKDTLERMNAGLVFGSLERDSQNTARLVETGSRKVAQMYSRLVEEATSSVPLIGGADFQPISFPPEYFSTIIPVVAFLRTLPLPASHPSHPAAPGILTALKEAQKAYAETRGEWERKCLELYATRVTERAETIEGVKAGHEFGIWIQNLLTIAEMEYDLLLELALLPTATAIETSFGTLTTPLASLFSVTLSSIVTLIKKSFHKHTFLALSTYASLQACQEAWDDCMGKRAGKVEKNNEMTAAVRDVRQLCLRSFPELIADIKLAANGRGGEFSTGLHEITHSTVKYLVKIPEVQDAVSSALFSVGDGNWKMGEGVQVGKAAGKLDTDERTILEHYLHDVITALINTLQTLSRTGKRPAFGSIFLLNNISHLRSNIFNPPPPSDPLESPPLEPTLPLSSLLAKPTQDALQSNFRTAKAAYFDLNFSPLMQSLQEDKDKKHGNAKDKFVKFFDLLEEVAERHRLARVLQEDKMAREQMADEVVKMVVPSLQRFSQRSKDFSKNPQKYIKMSADEVENLIRGFYADSDGKVVPVTERVQNNLMIQAGWSR